MALYLAIAVATLSAQTKTDAPEAHVAAAKAAAGQDFPGLFNTLCPATPAVPRGQAPPRGQGAGGGQRQGPPDRAVWHAEPVKVFDNLYWLGQTEYSVWAVTTSAGIIVVDTIYDYSVEDEVAGGLRKLGLDPSQIK
jgi:metallo-beta-lactamase class B